MRSALIEKVEARTVAVPLDNPTRIASRNLDVRHYTLVRVEAEGMTGVGFCLGGTPVTLFVRDLLSSLALGTEVFETERLWEALYHRILLLGRRGAGIRALSALDIALWDLKGKLLDLPVAHLLGVYQDPVPAYASGGYYVEGEGIRDLQAEVSAWADMGFSAIKIKIGGVPLEEDLARVRAIREAIGGEIRLMLDANNAWRDSQTALKAIRRFEEYNIEWIEEPLSPDDIEGHKRLADALDTTIATGEIEATRWGFAPIIRDRAADVIQADAAVVGGISEWRKIADTAAAFDMPVAPHWFADLHVHCVASAPNGTWIEYFADTAILNVMKLFDTALKVKDGYAEVPRDGGLGIEYKESEVERYALDAWS